MINLHALTFFQISNILECGLWIVLSLVMCVLALRVKGFARQLAWLAVPALFVFGISDLVEATTGAWWRPWWLLVWKGLCVIALLTLAVTYYRAKKVMAETANKPRNFSSGVERSCDAVKNPQPDADPARVASRV